MELRRFMRHCWEMETWMVYSPTTQVTLKQRPQSSRGWSFYLICAKTGFNPLGVDRPDYHHQKSKKLNIKYFLINMGIEQITCRVVSVGKNYCIYNIKKLRGLGLQLTCL